MTGPSTPPSSPCQTVACDLAAYASLTASADLIAEFRRCPGPGLGQRLAPSFFRNSDEQTVVGLACVFHALHGHGLDNVSFTDWAVVAAPHLLGRSMMVSAVQRFIAEGAWGISPNLIPHRSLHSMSGTASQAIKSNGPNFGSHSPREALYCAAGLLAARSAPSVVLICTGWEPEPLIPQAGGVPAESACVALAMALVPPGADRKHPRLTVTAGEMGRKVAGAEAAVPLNVLQLQHFFDAALAETRAPTSRIQILDDGGRLELSCETPSRVRPLTGESSSNGCHVAIEIPAMREAPK